MSFLNKKLFEFLGGKINKIIYNANKYLTKIKENELYLESLSNDQLREKTIEFKAKLVKNTKKIAYVIACLRKQAQTIKINNINTKLNLYKTIEKKKKKI